jgi:AbrB family looped-hinge helix DNA binding protein
MRITSKGQVTIPIAMREKLGLLPDVEVEFVLDRDSVRIKKARGKKTRGQLIVERLRGSASPGGMTTDQIMALTRGE